MEKRLFNNDWEFALGEHGSPPPRPDEYAAVEIPHDWLIWDTANLYRPGLGRYRKAFHWESAPNAEQAYLRFDGVYMDATLWLNGERAFSWKYGYSTFTVNCTPFLRPGKNELLVEVNYLSPNSRWYSGAGIYRNVWLLTAPAAGHIVPDGVYITPIRQENSLWRLEIDTELSTGWAGFEAEHHLLDGEGNLKARGRGGQSQALLVENPALWDIASPRLWRLQTTLYHGGLAVQRTENPFGFREIAFSPDKGFLLNGRQVKLLGACQHHDLGCLGAAFNPHAARRQLEKLREMGVNAIRTAHNMPDPQLMDLADEMGFLVCSEAFDMWERSKTEYDYARFFNEWAEKDVASWVRRDRNHPSLILWSIGNEIYDTHAGPRGLQLTQMLAGLVHRHDPKAHAPVTLGSNYMPWENAQKCADVVKIAGYNYAERLYESHHAAHPDWVIYGSETCSVVQSRGIYHFPLRQPLLADDDEQCSSLGNSSTSWGARSTEECILADWRAEFSAGQFIWTGTDYIGEPTPYHTKSSYFGQIDTAGFEKDSFYIFQAGWTRWQDKPMVHILPYWDFSPGQPIDVRVCSNAPEVELFLNGQSLGRQALGIGEGRLLANYLLPYSPGALYAAAYNPKGDVIASHTRQSFGNAAALCLSCKEARLPADGQSLAFVAISALDANGNPVENATNRVKVRVSGAGALVGLDNGDSADFEQYKTGSRRLFSGRLLAVVRTGFAPGGIQVQVSSPGLTAASLTLAALPAPARQGASRTLLACGGPNRENRPGPDENEIPVRKIELLCPEGFALHKGRPAASVRARIFPENASYTTLEWAITNAAGIPAPNASLKAEGHRAEITALGDGEIWLRCCTRNGGDKIRLISQLQFTAQGLGQPFLDPYGFISGGLYTQTNADLTNGNERGVATPRDGTSYIAFRQVDFGPYGSDTLTLPLFSLTPEPFPIEIWEGIPGEEGAEKLCTPTYTSGSRWNTYLPETYTLPRRLRGVATISFVFRQKVHLKGFSFQRQNKAFARLHGAENDGLYGDAFTLNGQKVEGIGNNVTLRFNGLGFGDKPPQAIVLCGRTPLDKTSIQLRLYPLQGAESVHILEFGHTPDYKEQRFSLRGLAPGQYDAELVFLPGSNFDFHWLQFV